MSKYALLIFLLMVCSLPKTKTPLTRGLAENLDAHASTRADVEKKLGKPQHETTGGGVVHSCYLDYKDVTNVTRLLVQYDREDAIVEVHYNDIEALDKCKGS